MYSKNAIRIYSFVISIVMTFVLQQAGMRIYQIGHNMKRQMDAKEKSTVVAEELTEENQPMQEQNMQRQEETSSWQILIPKIDLIAPIEEGVEQSTMKKAVGHFPQTSTWEGNVGLASHNRGIRSNFFEDIKQLTKGDIILYQKEGNQKQYAVETVTMISEYDWSYLQKTEDNRITLLTCVMNQPSYRLCVQAKEF